MSPVKGSTATKERIYVLDTNVLMHDPQSIFHFQEHHIYIPLEVLEELDNNKKGHSDIARNSRTVVRSLDSILFANPSDFSDGWSLEKESKGEATGRIFIQNKSDSIEIKSDNKILDAVWQLKAKCPEKEVVLVTKDINMRVKGCAVGLVVQDYTSDQVSIEDTDLLHTGSLVLPEDFWDANGNELKSYKDGNRTCYEVSGSQASKLFINEFVRLPGEERVSARVIKKNGNSAVLRTIHDYFSEKNETYGICALNDEQAYVLELLRDPEIDIVTLLGQAGSGKTLLTLAAGLKQVIEDKLYSEIIMTRATVPIGEEIGFLPGTEEDKMGPWMGALDDNLDVLMKDGTGNDWERAATRDILRKHIKVKSISFMRGRTFQSKYVIIDEAQNLTPKQVKTLITRVGNGSKIVCLGNLAQIDTPYLTEGSSGLTHLIERFKGWEHGGHITLLSGERSRIATYANEVL